MGRYTVERSEPSVIGNVMLTITSNRKPGEKEDTVLEIPDDIICGYNEGVLCVKMVPDEAAGEIRKIIFGTGMKRITRGMMTSFPYVTTIEIRAEDVIIDDNALSASKRLIGVKAESVLIIGASACEGLGNLSKFTVNKPPVISFGEKCLSHTKVNPAELIGEGTLEIGSEAFRSTPIGATITIPSTIQHMETDAFCNHQTQPNVILNSYFINGKSLAEMIELSSNTLTNRSRVKVPHFFKLTKRVVNSFNVSVADVSDNDEKTYNRIQKAKMINKPFNPLINTTDEELECALMGIDNDKLKEAILRSFTLRSLGALSFRNKLAINVDGVRLLLPIQYNSGIQTGIGVPVEVTTDENFVYFANKKSNRIYIYPIDKYLIIRSIQRREVVSILEVQKGANDEVTTKSDETGLITVNKKNPKGLDVTNTYKEFCA